MRTCRADRNPDALPIGENIMGTKEERSMRRRFVVRPTVSTNVNTNETEETVKPLKEVQER